VAFFDLGENEMPKAVSQYAGLGAASGSRGPTVEDVSERRNGCCAGRRREGVVDHEFIQSVYFFDPNGLRLEITTRTEAPGVLEQPRRSAHRQIEEWSIAKKARLEGRKAAETPVSSLEFQFDRAPRD